MLANPQCAARLRYLSQGRLFRLEVEYDKDEYFWLCADCASKMVLKVEKGRGVVTVPLPATPSGAPSASGEHNEMVGDLRPQAARDVFIAVNCSNDPCRNRIFLARAGEQYSSEKPDLPPLFKVVCPKCGKHQTVRRGATYFIEVDSTTVILTDIL
jgi:ssDNA-binding Zn-finger/Zn-ribbon topoisomerase 1